MGFNLDDLVMVPVATGLRIFNRRSLFRIFVQARSYEEIDAIRASLTKIGLENAEVQQFGSPTEVVVRVKKTSAGSDLGERIRAALTQDLPVREFQREEMVGPKIGAELRDKALLAILHRRFGVELERFDEVLPAYPTLADVDSAEALAEYQEKKRAYKAKLKAEGGSFQA